MDIYNNLKEIQKYCSEHNHKFNIEELARLTTKERDILKFIEEYDNKVSIHYDLEEFIDKYLTIITTTENIMISKQDEIEKLKEFLKETFIDYKELYESKNNIIIKQN